MKKFAVCLILALVCLSVFAEGWEVGAAVIPYSFATSATQKDKVVSDYGFGGLVSVHYCWDNGVFAGVNALACMTYYEDEIVGDWASLNLYGYAGYSFLTKGDFSLAAYVSAGAEFAEDVDLDDSLSKGFATSVALEGDFALSDNWSVCGGCATCFSFYPEGDNYFSSNVYVGANYAF